MPSTPNLPDGLTEWNWITPPRLELDAAPSAPVPCDSSATPMFSEEMARLMCRPL